MLKYFFVLVMVVGCDVARSQHPPFWDEIQQFKQQDRTTPPPANAILFVGSSSFRLWPDLQHDFPSHTVINRGFGGSSLTDVIRFADDIIFPYAPRQIVIYCGENDLVADSVDAVMVLGRFKQLMGMIRKKAKDVNVLFISIKPSPSRSRIQHKVVEANKLIKDFLKADKNASFVDIYKLMVDAGGEPLPKLFIADRLHMNADGYARWRNEIEPYLVK